MVFTNTFPVQLPVPCFENAAGQQAPAPPAQSGAQKATVKATWIHYD